MAQALGVHHASDGRQLHLFSRTPVPPRWRRLQRLHRLAPLVARWRLKSLREHDHDALAKDALA